MGQAGKIQGGKSSLNKGYGCWRGWCMEGIENCSVVGVGLLAIMLEKWGPCPHHFYLRKELSSRVFFMCVLLIVILLTF